MEAPPPLKRGTSSTALEAPPILVMESLPFGTDAMETLLPDQTDIETKVKEHQWEATPAPPLEPTPIETCPGLFSRFSCAML